MNEVYIQFKWENYGYQAGDVVKAGLLQRDSRGIQVHMFSNEPGDMGALIKSWSDLGSFRELTAMEVLALAARGEPIL